MLLNINNVVNGIKNLFCENQAQIDTLVNLYQMGRTLNIMKGERITIPNYMYPVLQLEPQDSPVSWFATRTRRADFNVRVILDVWNGDEEKAVEFLGLLTTIVGRILIWPPYAQWRIPGTAYWLVDSGATNLQYTTRRQGTIRRAEFMWTGWVIEQYPNSIFITGGDSPDDCTQIDVNFDPADLTNAGITPPSSDLPCPEPVSSSSSGP